MAGKGSFVTYRPDTDPPPHGAAAMADALMALCMGEEPSVSPLLVDAIRKHGSVHRSDAALNLRLMGLALAASGRFTPRVTGIDWRWNQVELLDLLRRQRGPDADLGLRGGPVGRLGSREGRSANYASFTHLALAACVLRPDLYGEDISEAARLVWRDDLVVYALCYSDAPDPLPPKRLDDDEAGVWTPEGRAITGDHEHGNDPRLTYAIQRLLGLPVTPRLGRDRWWWSARLWWEVRDPWLRDRLFSKAEIAALRAWVLSRVRRATLREMLAGIRLHDETVIQAGDAGEHVAWCPRLRSELDSKRDVVPVATPGKLYVREYHVSVVETGERVRSVEMRHGGAIDEEIFLPEGHRIHFPSLGVPEIDGVPVTGPAAPPEEDRPEPVEGLPAGWPDRELSDPDAEHARLIAQRLRDGVQDGHPRAALADAWASLSARF